MADQQVFVEHGFDGDVHVLRIANPPVNTLRTEVRAGLLEGLQRATREGARAIVLIGTGRGFSAGAEMTEFGKPRKPPSLNEVFEAIEQSKVPVVAAIQGKRWAVGWNSRWPAMRASPARVRFLACRRSSAASSPAPEAPSGCPG